jgi:hypothetical protein
LYSERKYWNHSFRKEVSGLRANPPSLGSFTEYTYLSASEGEAVSQRLLIEVFNKKVGAFLTLPLLIINLEEKRST